MKTKTFFFISLGLIGVLLFCVFLILIESSNGKKVTRAQNVQKESISPAEILQIKDLTRRMEECEKNIQRIYQNQLAINNKLKQMLQNDEALQKTNIENRQYISTIFQRIVDIEIQLQQLGGGYNLKRQYVPPGGGELPSPEELEPLPDISELDISLPEP